ncbi:MAG: NAD-dependent malic enzyme [Planctomycetes bacterium]|nr:NAD-dependent malic enzyme [Planctomycetota bacterium]
MKKTLPNWQERYNAKFIITLRIRVLDAPGNLASVLNVIADVGAMVGDIRIVGADRQHKIRDIQLFLVEEEHLDVAVDALRELPEIEILSITDEVLEIHRHGAIETKACVPLNTMMDLRMVYTPGVASVCQLIADKPEQAWKYTSKGNRIAIVTNGTAVLGLGDIGPLASLPVMEGKAAILAHFVGVSADPILIDSKDTDEIISIVAKLACYYGAIQLEDIAAPACFEIEDRLQEMLDVPVFHDDQHGTATVVVAGLINALKQTHRKASDCNAVILGAGAAGLAITKFLIDFGIGNVVVCDSQGAIYRGRTKRMNPWKVKIAEVTNKENEQGSLEQIIKGKNLFIGVARPRVVSKKMVASMSKDSIVFALANPVSEISVEDATEAGAAVAVDGRGMNNALAYPGIFKGTLDARAKRITPQMKNAAAQALADAAKEQLLPDMLDQTMHTRVAKAVAEAWKESQ